MRFSGPPPYVAVGRVDPISLKRRSLEVEKKNIQGGYLVPESHEVSPVEGTGRTEIEPRDTVPPTSHSGSDLNFCVSNRFEGYYASIGSQSNSTDQMNLIVDADARRCIANNCLEQVFTAAIPLRSERIARSPNVPAIRTFRPRYKTITKTYPRPTKGKLGPLQLYSSST